MQTYVGNTNETRTTNFTRPFGTYEQINAIAYSFAIKRIPAIVIIFISATLPRSLGTLSSPAWTSRRWSRMYVAACSFVFSYTAVKMLIDNCVAPPDHRLALCRVSTATTTTTTAMLFPSHVVTLRVPLRDTSRLSRRVSHSSISRIGDNSAD